MWDEQNNAKLNKLLPYYSKTHNEGTWYSLRKESALLSQLV